MLLLRRVPNLTGSRENLLCLNPVSLGFNFDSIPAWKFSKGRRRIPELRKSSLKKIEMDPVRTPSSLEATGASENDVQVMIPVSDEELVAPTMAGLGTPEVSLDGSRFEAYRFPAPTCPEYAEAVAPRQVPSASNMTTAELANAMEVLSLLNQSGRLQQMVQQIDQN